VRDQRASEIFWTVLPMLNGMRRRKASHCGRPHEEDSDQDVPLPGHGVGEADREARDQRQLAAEVLEHAHEHGDDERDHADQDEHREAEYDDRVGHRGLDLAAQRVVLLELVGDPLERLFEHAAGLTRADHRDVQRAEDLWVALQGVGEVQAGLDVLADPGDRLAQQLALDLLLEHVEGAQERHAGRDHRRQLARHHRQL
jgi:hypothetical protein